MDYAITTLEWELSSMEFQKKNPHNTIKDVDKRIEDLKHGLAKLKGTMEYKVSDNDQNVTVTSDFYKKFTERENK